MLPPNLRLIEHHECEDAFDLIERLRPAGELWQHLASPYSVGFRGQACHWPLLAAAFRPDKRVIYDAREKVKPLSDACLEEMRILRLFISTANQVGLKLP